jgi:hypothetical protein
MQIRPAPDRRTRRLARLVPVLAIACGGASAPPPPTGGGPPQTTCPIAVAVAAPRFRADVLPVLVGSCGSASPLTCHGSPNPAGHVSFDPAAGASSVRTALVGADPVNAPTGWKRVLPGDPARSWLVEKLTKDDPGGTGRAYGNRMPSGLPNLCAPTVQAIEDWIAAGAADD